MRQLHYLICLAVIVGSCAQPKAIVTPTPSAAPPKPETSPSVLSPQVGREEEDRLKNDTNARIERAEKIVRQIELNNLARDQQEILSSTRSFITKAKEALANKDYFRAFNLADKAQILAEELSKTLL